MATATATAKTTATPMLLLHALLALTALQLTNNSLKEFGVEALPITSRPIEGNAQLLAWEEWQRLSPDQRTLEKEKKVTAKSIFTLPFRHCPPGHKQYGDRCIPQINIDPTDLVKQELLELIGEGDASNGSPTGNTDYDYSDSESDELIFNVPLIPLMQTGQLPTLPSPTGSGNAEDQALPSEDAPLKFNIFENKYPTALETSLQPEAVNATMPTTTVAVGTATATTTPMPTIATMREDALKLLQQKQQQPDNRIAEQFDDLQADASHSIPSTTSLSIPSSSSSSSSNIHAFGHIGDIEAIVVPAGLPLDNEKSSVQLVSSSSETNEDTNVNMNVTTNADADEVDMDTEPESEMETSEQGLAQLLKVDTLLPAFGSSMDLLPPFSHRRVSPLLSADLDDGDETAATDMAPTGDNVVAATPTTTAKTAMTATTAATATGAAEKDQEEELDERVVLKKSKVQPVQLSSTVATTTTAAAAATTIVMPTTISESSTTTTTAAAAAAKATTSSTDPAAAAAVTATTTAATVAAKTKVAAIHQDANGKARDDDRFYYQHFARNVAGSDSSPSSDSSTSTSTSTSTTTDASSNVDGDLDVLNYMASSDNLMTNTIGGQGEVEKAASEMNFEQELRIINELVKGKWRLSQLRQQQQQQQQEQQQLSSSSTVATTETTPTTTISVESSSEASSTTAATSDVTATTATAATESTAFWSKLMPIQSQSTTAATTATATEETAETIPAAATATTIVADSSTTATATATATHLSINTNRSNRNSKIIRIDSIVENPTTTPATTTATATTAATTTAATTSNISSNDDAAGYTPFWWLPNFGMRLDRQVDENGEDRSLLLRFFKTFSAGNTATTSGTSATSTTWPSQ